MTEQDLLDEVVLGKRAEELLADPTIQRAFADIESAIVTRWKGIDAHDLEEAAHQKNLLTALGMVRNAFLAYVNNGVIADKELARKRAPIFKFRR